MNFQDNKGPGKAVVLPRHKKKAQEQATKKALASKRMRDVKAKPLEWGK